MVNRVILIGNLGKDPEVRRLENGTAVAKLRLATNESYKDKSGAWLEQTEWHDVILWRTLAERAERTLRSGMTVYVEGKLTHRSWQDQDGNSRRTTEVVANYLRIVSGPGAGRQDEKQAGSSGFPSPEDETPNTPEPTPEQGQGSAGDDLPF